MYLSITRQNMSLLYKIGRAEFRAVVSIMPGNR